MVTKEEWVDWKRHPVTQAFLRGIMTTRDGKKEEIAEGKVEGNQLYLEIGRCQGIQDTFEYAVYKFDYVQIEDNNDTESSSFSSTPEG